MAHAHHHHAAPSVTEGRTGFRRGAAFIIGGLSSGHGVFHSIQQSFIVVIPEVRNVLLGGDTLVGNLAVTSIQTTREIASGVVALPGGVLTDALRRYWGWVMAVCMALFGVGWLLMAAAGWQVPGSTWVAGSEPTVTSTALNPVGYALLLVGMAVVAIAASVWHLPAMASLSNRFAERRGFALSVYGVGGNVGEILGPATTGLLLGMLTWQSIIGSYALLPLLLMLPVHWAFRDIGSRQAGSPSAQESANLSDQLGYTRQMFRNGVLWGIIAIAGLRGMAFVAFTAVVALYSKDVLDLSDQTRGFYFSLLGLVGMTASPLLGHLSDRFGRKMVLVPNLLALGVLTLLMAWYGHLGAFPVLLLLMGVFLYSDQPVLTAAALDVAGRRTTTTAIGFVSFSRLALSAPSPVIAGWLYRPEAVHAVFYYIAGLFFLAACGLFLLPLRKG